MSTTAKNDFMQNEVRYRKRPRLQWEVVERLGTMRGGLNAGIFKVRTRSDTLGRVFIEKRFGQTEFQFKIPWGEIRMLHQISDHPNITTMVDHFLDESIGIGSVFLEYCDMGSLANVAEMVGTGTDIVNEHKIWKWFMQTMEALVYCHRGPEPEVDAETLKWDVVYHRDIKPPNVLLKRNNGQVIAKLADFGCATSQSWTWIRKRNVDASNASVKTYGFDAPEHPTFLGSTDIWQLALTMVCVCTGIGDPESKLNPRGQRWSREYPAGGYSKELNEILKWCLILDAKQRPTTLPVSKALRQRYSAIEQKLLPDTAPLEILDRSGGRNLRALQLAYPLGQNQLGISRDLGQPILPLGGFRTPHAADFAHMMLEPIVYRTGPQLNRYANIVHDDRLRASIAEEQHIRRANGLLDNDNHPPLQRELDSMMLGRFHLHPEFFPSFHLYLGRGRKRR